MSKYLYLHKHLGEVKFVGALDRSGFTEKEIEDIVEFVRQINSYPSTSFGLFPSNMTSLETVSTARDNKQKWGKEQSLKYVINVVNINIYIYILICYKALLLL